MGTTNPSSRFEVTGNILVSGTITSSDKRYKTKIQPIPDAMQLIKQLLPVSYWYRSKEFAEDQFDDKKHYVVIAQELQRCELYRLNWNLNKRTTRAAARDR